MDVGVAVMEQAFHRLRYSALTLATASAVGAGAWGLLRHRADADTAPAQVDASAESSAEAGVEPRVRQAIVPSERSPRLGAGLRSRYAPLSPDTIARGQSPDPEDRYAMFRGAAEPYSNAPTPAETNPAQSAPAETATAETTEANPLRQPFSTAPLAARSSEAAAAFLAGPPESVERVRYDQPAALGAAAPVADPGSVPPLKPLSSNPFDRPTELSPPAGQIAMPDPGSAPPTTLPADPTQGGPGFPRLSPPAAVNPPTGLPESNTLRGAGPGPTFAEANPAPSGAPKNETAEAAPEAGGFGPSKGPSAYSAPSDSRTADTQAEPGGALTDGPIGSGKPGERALEGSQQPSLVIEKIAPAEVQVGKPAKFVTKVRNVGRRTAQDVVVRDLAPAGTQLLATSPQAETLPSAEGEVVWRLGALSPGEERMLTMQLMPIEEGEIGSVATVAFAAEASARVRCTRPQLALRMTAPAKVLVGRQQIVVIELHNPGTGDATDVVLFERVPDNLTHAAGPAVEFEVGTLRPGETRRLELVMTAEQAGRVVNQITARAAGGISVDQQVEFEIVAPGLEVSVEGPSRRFLDRPATYVVNIENPGTAAAKDVQVVTHLPRGMKFVKANNMGEYDASNHAVYWSLAELPEGQSGAVELTTLPITAGDQTLRIEGRAREGLSDEASQQVRIEGIAAIAFEVRDLEDPIEVGGDTAYEVRVVNQGSKAATNIVVRAIAPAGLVMRSAKGPSPHEVRGAEVVFAPLATLEPGAEASYRIEARGATAGDQRLTVEVMTDDLQQPVRREESTQVFGDE